MNKPNLPWWSSMRFRRPKPTPDADYADMGTAFGLDASFGPVEQLLEVEPAVAEDGLSTDRLNRRSVI